MNGSKNNVITFSKAR